MGTPFVEISMLTPLGDGEKLNDPARSSTKQTTCYYKEVDYTPSLWPNLLNRDWPGPHQRFMMTPFGSVFFVRNPQAIKRKRPPAVY